MLNIDHYEFLVMFSGVLFDQSLLEDLVTKKKTKSECTYFVIMFVERDSLTQEARTPTLASILSIGGYTPISFTCSAKLRQLEPT